MDVSLFDFELPGELIALRPAVPRDSARMLVVREDGSLAHAHVRDLPNWLRCGDMLVVNDTKVGPARLSGIRKARGEGRPSAKIEVTLIGRIGPRQYRALARPAKRLHPNDAFRVGKDLDGHVLTCGDRGEVMLEFGEGHLGNNVWETPDQVHARVLEQASMPLPPYIASKRQPDAQDLSDYQTMFATKEGAIAAPTAGLHFTRGLTSTLDSAGISRESVTLHVGAGTFLPVTTADTKDHGMHAEWAEISDVTAHAINSARNKGGRIVAVGTTSLRTLETACDDSGRLRVWSGDTSLFITPGYDFKTADVLLTNFHLPRSTLFMLVCAFSGTQTMKRAYAEAIAQRYRFYSYGDACLLFRPKP